VTKKYFPVVVYRSSDMYVCVHLPCTWMLHCQFLFIYTLNVTKSASSNGKTDVRWKFCTKIQRDCYKNNQRQKKKNPLWCLCNSIITTDVLNTGLFKTTVGVQLSSGNTASNSGKQPPSDNSIRRWYAQFQETGWVCIPELKVRIRIAIETITADML